MNFNSNLNPNSNQVWRKSSFRVLLFVGLFASRLALSLPLVCVSIRLHDKSGNR